ncbi:MULTISPECIES: GNAT family N-acetyltransferase [Rhizobium]|jgi:[ribosomal protein S5]-alanine N-acetyltransferase|uniref:GCN5 family acetyltransferase n=1 Tax=Rhizobium nepotum 39/7 TaxID=1368418 RepID=A0ABR5CRD6_9HYPH|nr:GNAT family protein [Rhizobium nepotum]KJF67382.1 GCN5 family acetyltransferase [Rhizobium nepotum 39/7]
MLRFLSRHNDTPELRSADHLLRLPRYGDFRQWHVLRSESRQFLQPWEPAWRPDELTEGSFRTRVVRNGQEFSSGTAVSFLLFEKETLLVGGITIGYIRRGAAQSCMIGYWVGERYAAQGHMSAALKLVIPYIFSGLQLHRIEAACIPENFKSIRLLENAGFQREGLLREYLKINGQWRDHMMFSLLADKQSSGGTKYDT